MTALGARPISIRLAVALTYDAAVMGFGKVFPGSKLERLIDEDSEVHPHTET